MDSKKVIEKLVKIAENQQKIINRLAREAGLISQGAGQDVSAQAAQVLSQIPEATQTGAAIQEAQLGAESGSLFVKLKFPHQKYMDSPVAAAAKDKLKAALQQTQFTDSTGKPVAVKTVNVTGLYG